MFVMYKVSGRETGRLVYGFASSYKLLTSKFILCLYSVMIAFSDGLFIDVLIFSFCLQLCVQKLRILIEDSDQNCKYFVFLFFYCVQRLTFYMMIFFRYPKICIVRYWYYYYVFFL